MNDAREALKKRAEADGIQFFFAMFVDMHGKPCAKLMPAEAFDVMMDGGAGFAGFAAGPMGQTPSDPDLVAMPDPSSYVRVPWQPELAVLQCDIHVDGKPWGFSPRVILKRQLARLAERDFTYMVGTEAEYFLVSRNADGSVRVADVLDTATSPCYDVKALTRMYPHLTAVARYCNELGWGNYANDHEDANGQFEQNFHYTDALTAADRLIFFRYMVHTLAHEAGMAATFMPKVFSHSTGNGLHMHSSLWRGDEQMFLDESDERGLGMSKLGYSFVGGLVQHAHASMAVTCPTVNSYKRMGVGAPVSGATWAPAYATYGGNNRTQMLRIPDGGRVEHRGCDGSANPYLALTVMLAAGLDGVDRELDPGEPNRDNLYSLSVEQIAERGIASMPPTLLHAAEALVKDDVLREALGKESGGDYIDYFAQVKDQEFRDYHSVVSDWEIDRYLSLF